IQLVKSIYICRCHGILLSLRVLGIEHTPGSIHYFCFFRRVSGFVQQQILGHSLVDRNITYTLTKLWEGPLSPMDLDLVELGLRALLISNKLSISRVYDPWDSGFHGLQPHADEVKDPFGDHLLDYEFEDPFSSEPQIPLPSDEAGYLESIVSENLSTMANAVIPKWIEFDGQAMAYLDAWYAGWNQNECEANARSMIDWENYLQKYPSDTFSHAVFHRGPAGDAKYIVSVFCAGLGIYSSSPIDDRGRPGSGLINLLKSFQINAN
ncbi:MAG: hypothetical protein K9J85_06565, partial [Desulfobacteraceae bacterium]|nr:hypothetical protein [Desulfobacteraceae bacterium]